jgi:hypothetical protein
MNNKLLTTEIQTPIKIETLNERFNRICKCTERKTYRDTRTGEICYQRCIRRKAPAPIRGANYHPTDDTSIPWEII